jgi:hypothetical protein
MTYQPPTRFKPYSYFELPGEPEAPVIFMPPLELAGELQVWIAATGSGNWGGCEIHVSDDDETYLKVGAIIGKSRMGILTSELPACASTPDEINTLQVDLSMSAGVLDVATEQAAQNLRTLCYVDGEYLAYADALLTALYKYDLTYLIRGAYGSERAAHLEGSSFVRLDAAIFKMPISAFEAGRTVYIKLLPFNIMGQKLALADMTAHEFVVPDLEPMGLSQPKNLMAATSDTAGQVDIECSVVELQDSRGVVQVIQDRQVTIDLTTTGANGLDEGSLAAESAYRLYLIMDRENSFVAGLASLSDDPVMPSGYTFKRLVSLVFTDTGGNLIDFGQQGPDWFVEESTWSEIDLIPVEDIVLFSPYPVTASLRLKL